MEAYSHPIGWADIRMAKECSPNGYAGEEVLKQILLPTAGRRRAIFYCLTMTILTETGNRSVYDCRGVFHPFRRGGDETWFKGKFYVAGADGCTQALDNSYGVYRMIDGVMDFGSRKSLFFYTDYCVTADLSEIWTVRGGKPVEESNLLRNR